MNSRLRFGFVAAATVGLTLASGVGGATAQFLFFGGNDRGWSNNRGFFGERGRDDRRRYRQNEERGSSFGGDWRQEADPEEDDAPRRPRRSAAPSSGGGGGGGGNLFCVRTCDGYYFPVARPAGGIAEAKTLCAGLCPAAETEVYSGRSDAIGEARTQAGKTYASLPAAFSYRQDLKPDCGCKAAGATALNAEDDPTLKAGDIVMSENGPVVFNGASRRPYKTSDFTDYRKSRSVAGGLRSQLDALASRYYNTRAQATKVDTREATKSDERRRRR